MIPSEDKSLMASLSLFGGISTFGRPSQRVVATGDIVHLVFQAPAGATPELNLVVTPEESGTCGSVVVRYSGIDRSHLTQTRLNYRQFTQPLLLDALVTVTPVAEP